MYLQLVSLGGSPVADGTWDDSALCAELFAKAWQYNTVCSLFQQDRRIFAWEKIESLAPEVPVQVIRSSFSTFSENERPLRRLASKRGE